MEPTLTARQARLTALGAQGLVKGRPATVTSRSVGRVLKQLHLLQIDSVNVLSRSHYLPLFSRLGPYDTAVPDRLASKAPRQMVEYWAHEASYVRPELFPDLRTVQRRVWMTAHSLPTEVKNRLSEQILGLLAGGPPLTAREIADRLGGGEVRTKGNWGWNWNASKRVLEDLFASGLLSSAGRTPQFERLYAPTAAVHPAGPAALEPSDPQEAVLRLTELAARAHGVATVRCLADYFRLPQRETASAAAVLVRTGKLRRVRVAGWRSPAYLHAETVIPRRSSARALLSPFDSMVFERKRLEALFGFRYRLEIYTPPAARRYGYYVLPFLLGEEFAARVDLKADRSNKALLVQAAHREDGAPARTAVELAAELRMMADWLGLDDVIVKPSGDLAEALKLAVCRE
ncbi:crosslink repair DNA glycosylase YcaQ family protein [Arthrobacter sp. zg-Y820]|uniref:winged helix-turn-helix domain-containing protein n=1 Tax=unclassified Arthrobacter TaxID=235627 RepID=UPI001E45D2C8|nr:MULTISPECIES: crosslink repair DNA glycosylase YcaQ family protein [unclassified Arthrobacter]MCC9195985.1 winged helix DNA-binding domain-containing protein [Arthrobacter sp. zg-Y820]MDK1278844.1 crosslink repair DNA glycosylase YcaQ family protein [Arthrobacter sp. zg.Y820]WIB08740.1 crosslink repair DNA glycosylase YcaQ family protein [Arthrobacter sp. zg-Y820]